MVTSSTRRFVPRTGDGLKHILVEETIRRYGSGRDPRLLSNKSHALVVIRCSVVGCSSPDFERVRRNVVDGAVCARCAHVRLSTDEAFERRKNKQVIDATCVTCQKAYRATLRHANTVNQCKPCRVTARLRKKYGTRPDNGEALLVDDADKKRSDRSHHRVAFRCSKSGCLNVESRARRDVWDTSMCWRCSHVNVFGKAEEDLIAAAFPDTGVKRGVRLPSKKELDVVLETQKLAVEYCGLYWHHENSPAPRTKYYHRDKMLEAETAGYQLVTLFEDEWLERKTAVVSRLRSIAGLNQEHVGARTCSLQDIPKTTACAFLESYHLQGAGKVLRAWGLFDKNNILSAVLTLGRHHRGNDPSVAVLNRFCVRPDLNLPGGASRLLKAATTWARQNGFTSMISWSDNRWSRGTVYQRLGFKLAAELPPAYSYVVLNRPGKRLSKQSQKKTKVVRDAALTEREWTTQQGLSRIWDCGLKRWELALV